MPRNIVIDRAAIIASVVAAFLDFGYLNAGTALEMASTPVRAVVPAEKALRMMKKVRAD
jgi:hypothetical protein